MRNSIRLSEKHGVNPSLIVCFWCGDSTGVALAGRLAGDAKAPKNMYVDYEPCDKCKTQMSKGTLLMEVGSQPVHQGQTPMKQGNDKVYPSGRWLVLMGKSADNFLMNIKPPELQAAIRSAGKVVVEHGVFQTIVDLSES